MKKWLLAISLLLQGTCSLAAEPVTLYSHDFRPFTWVEKGKVQGFAYELIQDVQQELHLRQEVEVASFKRALLQVQMRPSTAMFVFARTPEREKTVKWVGPLYSGGVYLYRLKGSSLRLDKLDDLRGGVRVGVQNGLYEEAMLSAAGVRNLYRSNSVELTLRALLNKRVDAIPLGDDLVADLLRKEGLAADRIEKTGLKLFDSNLYMAFSLNVSDETITRWQQALDKVKRTRYAELERKYLR